MKKLLYLFLIAFLFIANIWVADAQHQQHHHKSIKHPSNKFHKHHLSYINNIRLTALVGLSSYYGDLCDQFVCFRYRPGVTIGGYYRYSGRVSFRGDVTYLRMAGNDKDGVNKKRNLSFRSPNLEVAIGVMYDLIYFERNYHLRAKFTPYLFAEVGLLYYNPRAQYNGQWYTLRPLMTEGVSYKKTTFSVPFGGGVRYQINTYMDLSFELAYRKTFSDYLDDVSKDYVQLTDPTAAALADRSFEGGYNVYDSKDGIHWKPGHKRGNPNKKDGYFLFGFKFEYMIKTTAQVHTLNSMPRFRNRFSGMHRKTK